jgi:predicted TIM-barrel fold metal-dependent hydrolase
MEAAVSNGTLTKGHLEGQILDCDAHLYMEPALMEQIVGDVGGGFVLDFLKEFSGSEQDVEARAKNRDDVWTVKGISALGACGAEERLEAMDATGVKAQILFPNTSLLELRIDSDAARAACRRYNDYAIEWTKLTDGRARVVCQINMGNAEWAIEEARRVVELGAKGVLLPCSSPPAGVSPANDIWDPFWKLLSDAKVPAFLHIGAGGVVSSAPPDPMIPPREFSYATALKQSFEGRAGGEEAIGPFYILVCHMAPEVFLQTLVMGGVFERFPDLAFGVIECGASWVGPMCERMDAHANLMAKVGFTYPMKPSEYVRRNVRVTPLWAEDLTKMVERYGLDEVYVFSSDYPHLEGSRDPVGKFAKWVDKLPADFERRFYIDNAKILFP